MVHHREKYYNRLETNQTENYRHVRSFIQCLVHCSILVTLLSMSSIVLDGHSCTISGAYDSRDSSNTTCIISASILPDCVCVCVCVCVYVKKK